MDVLIVGSLAYDSLETPAGSVENELGGSASYGGFSAAFHNNGDAGNGVGIVGVIGQDFQSEHMEWYKKAGLDISGIEVNQGETFRWKGSYHGSMAEAVTHETHLNVFENFQPKVPQSLKKTKVLMCANLHPALQASVLSQTEVSRVSLLDSMNLWIEIANQELKDVMKQVDILILNDGEVRMLAGEENLIVAAKAVLEMKNGGILVVKKGENGVIAFHPEGMISMPSFPTSNLVDPTGVVTVLQLHGTLLSKIPVRVREKLANSVHATVTASFTIESFGTERIRKLSADEYESRLLEYRSITKTS